jgi:anti-sigma factor RsiW
MPTHVNPDKLELYALGRLSDTEVAAIEEHLLVCHRCQDELERTDRDIAHLKDVLRQQDPEAET